MDEQMGTRSSDDRDTDCPQDNGDAALERLRRSAEHALQDDGQVQVPGVRCRPGIVTGRARGVRPVTDPDKETAEDAVRESGRRAARAAAQAICDQGRCPREGDRCTFVPIAEAIEITTTPSRDAQGRLQWTATLDDAAAAGVCVCRRGAPGQPGEKPYKGFWMGGDGAPFRFGVPDDRGLVIVPPASGGTTVDGRDRAPAPGEGCGCGEPVGDTAADGDTCGPASVEAKGRSLPVTDVDPERARMEALRRAREAARASAAESCTGGCVGAARQCAYVEESISTHYEIRLLPNGDTEVSATAVTKGACRCPPA